MIEAQGITGLTVEHPDYGTCEVVRRDGQWLLISYPVLHMASGEERQMQRWVDVGSVIGAIVSERVGDGPQAVVGKPVLVYRKPRAGE